MGAEASQPAVPAIEAGETPTPTSAVQPDGTPRALVIVGPSGVGKGTLISRLVEGREHEFGFSVSHTTRQPRTGEKHGVDYMFTSKEQFAKDVAEGRFLEYAQVHNNLYGTSLAAVRKVLEQGKVCLLDIDVQGARSVRRTPLRAIFVFVAPPSLEDLAKRLVGRGTESVAQIKKRQEAAKDEINSLNEKGLYDYLIINDNLEEAVEKLRYIAERCLAGLDPEPGQVPESVIIEDAPLPELQLPTDYQPSKAGSDQATAADPATPEPQQPSASLAVPSASPSTARGGSEDQQAAGPSSLLPGSSTSDSSADNSSGQQGPGGGQQGPREVAAPGAVAPLGMQQWEGKVALVTGASSGIGWATCEALALAGMRVIAVARRRERLEALHAHMASLNVPLSHFLPVVCDITKDLEINTLTRIVAKRWPEAGGVDVLVNNAGMSRNDASLMNGNVNSWVEMLSTNVLGTAMTTRVVVQDMRRRGQWGHIINMVGLSGHRIPDGPQGGGFYCATKAAVKTLTEGLRQEARGEGVPLRVSAISPGIVETEFFAVRAYGDKQTAQKTTSALKCLQPADIAQAVLWCLSSPPHVEVNDVVLRPTEQLV
ncbi:P-loop containing nucleoside triphosphate hydrolase protein [Haematococcus lacustris]